ncbi:MAG: enhancer of mRNA decapping [Vezdaea acicularis]|nr:MAG: enhancer of mRNA decapping [Vezdaea acicularis]
MAEQFIGLEVLVTLTSPPNAQVEGIVKQIDGTTLVLNKVHFLQTGHHVNEYRLDAAQLTDIEIRSQQRPTSFNNPVLQEQPTPTPAPTSISNARPQAHPNSSVYQQIYASQPNPNLSQPKSPLYPPAPLQNLPINVKGAERPSSVTPTRLQHAIDPAIVSFDRKPKATNGQSTPQGSLSTTIPPIPASILPGGDQSTENDKIMGRHFLDPQVRQPKSQPTTQPSLPSAAGFEDASANSLAKSMNTGGRGIETDDLEDAEDVSYLPPAKPRGGSTQAGRQGEPAQATSNVKKDGYTGKRSRRGKGRTQKEAMHAGSQTQNALGSSPVQQRKSKRGNLQANGWRQDAFTEHPGAPEKRVAGVIGGPVGLQAASSSSKRGRKQRAPANDDQDGWATGDATDIQTRGDFDFAENLSKFDKKSVFSQIRADDTTADEERLVSFNRLAQAKPGTGGGKNLHPTENVLDSEGAKDAWNSEAGDSEDDESESESERDSRRGISNQPMSRQSTRQRSSRKGSAITGVTNHSALSNSAILNSLARGQVSSSNTLSPKPSRKNLTGSPVPSILPSKPSLRILANDRPCSVINPLQMLDVERIAEVETEYTEDMMTENAARGIAEVALSVISPGGRRMARENRNSLPVVVILAGNNKSGARAIAAGRHLYNHGIRVITCVMGLEREEELLKNVRLQLNISRKTGGKLVPNWRSLTALLEMTDSPPELIVDGLLGMHVAFEDLRNDDQNTAYELISWANMNNANVLAIDIPSGCDASSGEITKIEGDQSIYLRAKFVVAMGAPKTGVLNACITGAGSGWQLFVADIGISNIVWKKYGTRRRYGVEFGSEWVVGLRYDAGVE